ncbi:MAG: hypothetical protein ACRBFS_17810 [Aureispira sp.]
MTLKFFALIFASVFLIHCTASSTTTQKKEGTTAATTNQKLKGSIETYFEDRSQCFIYSEDPLLVGLRANADSSDWINCTDGGDTQLEMNFCAAADACLEIRRMNAFKAEVLLKKPEQEQAFLKDLWKELQAIEKAAEKEGKSFEGGSMKPLVVSATRTTLLEKKRAEMRAKWL